MKVFKNMRNVQDNAELLLAFGIGCRLCNSTDKAINNLIDQKAALAILALALLQAPLILLDKKLYSLAASSRIGMIFAVLFTSIFKFLSVASYLAVATPIALAADVVITPISNMLLTVLSCLEIGLSPVANRFKAFFDRVFDYVRPKAVSPDSDCDSSYRSSEININNNMASLKVIIPPTKGYLPSSPNNRNASGANYAAADISNDITRSVRKFTI